MLNLGTRQYPALLAYLFRQGVVANHAIAHEAVGLCGQWRRTWSLWGSLIGALPIGSIPAFPQAQEYKGMSDRDPHRAGPQWAS
jgi:hypothetical protein